MCVCVCVCVCVHLYKKYHAYACVQTATCEE